MSILTDFLRELSASFGVGAASTSANAIVGSVVGNAFSRNVDQEIIGGLRHFRGRVISRQRVHIRQDQLDAFNIGQHFDSTVASPIHRQARYPNSDSLNNFRDAIRNWHRRNFEFGGSGFVHLIHELDLARRANAAGNDEPLVTLLTFTVEQRDYLERFRRHVTMDFLPNLDRSRIARVIQYAQTIYQLASMPFSTGGHMAQSLGLRTIEIDTVVMMTDLASDVKGTLQTLLTVLDFILKTVDDAIDQLASRIRILEIELAPMN